MNRLSVLLLLCALILISCSNKADSSAYCELDSLIDLSVELEVCIDSDGIPYYDGYTVLKENFNKYVVGAGWSSDIDMYEVVQNGSRYVIKDSEPWEPPYIYDFYVNSSVSMTDYINYFIDSLPYDVLLYKNSDYEYLPDGTVRLSDNTFFMRVVYASSDVFQAFKYLYTDQSGKSHYALCTFRKMTQERLNDFQNNYCVDYYKYVSDAGE